MIDPVAAPDSRSIRHATAQILDRIAHERLAQEALRDAKAARVEKLVWRVVLSLLGLMALPLLVVLVTYGLQS